MKKQIVQGDIYFIKVPSIPDKAKTTQNRVVAYGEKTGHSHTITGAVTVFEDNNAMYIFVDEEGAEVVHNTHMPVVLDKGIWMSGHVREFNPFLDQSLNIRD